MCAEAERVVSDASLTDDERRMAVEAWGREGDRMDHISAVAHRGEGVGEFPESDRVRAVFADVAPDISCDAFLSLAGPSRD